MKIEKLPSGSYRIRKTRNKKTYTLVFDHKPTQKEIDEGFYEQYRLGARMKEKPIKKCVSEYLESRENVVSPTTMRGYKTIERSISDSFMNKNVFQLEQIDIQTEISNYAKDHAPKSVRNYHGFISAVIKTYRPEMVITTTFPQDKPFEHYKPIKNDIEKILELSADSKYHIAFQLGIMGLRRGEVAGIDINTDLKGNTLHIHRVMIETENGWIYKEVPKNETSNREIELPIKLVNEIKKQGYVIDTTPPMIVHELHKCQDQLGIPHFRFHDLRHYFASYLHSMKIPDIYIQEMGGWKSDYTMKKVYREAQEDKSKQMKKQAAKTLLP